MKGNRMTNKDVIIDQLIARIRKLERDLDTATTLGRASILDLELEVQNLKGGGGEHLP